MINHHPPATNHLTFGPNARLALDTIAMKATNGIPTYCMFLMDMPFMERMSGYAPGDYQTSSERVYLDFQRACGVCMIDQFIPDNPLTMGGHGYVDDSPKGATEGAAQVVVDGIAIDSPEAVVEHMERFLIPAREKELAVLLADEGLSGRMRQRELAIQQRFGPNLLKAPYGLGRFPTFHYSRYGYENYFMAYALYPEVMERDFELAGRLFEAHNRQAARAIVDGGLPYLVRLDHDMADSRGTLVDVRSLDRIWFPHFLRSIRPFQDAGIRLIWHCDGNLMEMVPRLLDCGLGGFQGFQYEDGMDYQRICRMTDCDGNPLLIIAGVSVTTTLPFGTPDDVKKQLKWLVDCGPRQGLFLSVTSSVTPGTSHDNLRTLIEGLRYYREGMKN